MVYFVPNKYENFYIKGGSPDDVIKQNPPISNVYATNHDHKPGVGNGEAWGVGYGRCKWCASVIKENANGSWELVK